MMHVPHDLREEFPQEASLIERLIKDNYQFRRLAERYDEVNREIYRIESDEAPTTDEVLERLIKDNYQFRRLSERYDEVNREIHRIESEEAPTTDEVLERLKKRRLKLKDEIAGILAKVERRM